MNSGIRSAPATPQPAAISELFHLTDNVLLRPRSTNGFRNGHGADGSVPGAQIPAQPLVPTSINAPVLLVHYAKNKRYGTGESYVTYLDCGVIIDESALLPTRMLTNTTRPSDNSPWHDFPRLFHTLTAPVSTIDEWNLAQLRFLGEQLAREEVERTVTIYLDGYSKRYAKKVRHDAAYALSMRVEHQVARFSIFVAANYRTIKDLVKFKNSGIFTADIIGQMCARMMQNIVLAAGSDLAEPSADEVYHASAAVHLWLISEVGKLCKHKQKLDAALVKAVDAAKRFIQGSSHSLETKVRVTGGVLGILGAGSFRGYPDWTTLRTRTVLDPLYASVMCGIVRDQGPESGRNDVCARRSLENVLSEATQRFQLHFLIAFEVEFEIWRPNADGKLVLHSTGLGGAACSGLRHAWYDYVEEVMLILLEAGVGLEGMHTEGQQGQFEFNLEPKPPMEAVDELVFVHDTLKRVFAHHGLVVTMFPRPAAHRTQSIGQHVHVSITDRPELEHSFLAGVLRHLPNLVAFSLPYDLSYERLRPGQGGGDIVAWGTQDRRVPLQY
ncbi:hypothetical protein MY4824_009210 [Beauveria thailandica]